MLGTLLSSVGATIIPLSSDEVDIRRYVYRTKHPERRHPSTIRVPFIDESESWYYEIIYFFELYCLTYFTVLITNMIVVYIFANNVFIALCLYQLVASSIQLSPIRYLKFFAFFFGIMLEFFLICNSSEHADDCNPMVRNAIKYSSWENSTTQTKRTLCMMLRRVQKSNHARFHQGAIVLSRLSFHKVVKVAYTFVNFIRTCKN
ncbi:hypothetical protein WDU94_006281 [Cyamophila willieti]